MISRFPRPSSISWLCASLVVGAVNAAPSDGPADSPHPSEAPSAAVGSVVAAGLEAMMTVPLVSLPAPAPQGAGAAPRADASAWIRGRGWKAGVGRDGFHYIPVVGDAPDASVRMRIAGVRIGGQAMEVGALQRGPGSGPESGPESGAVPHQEAPDRVSVERSVGLEGFQGQLSESYEFNLDSIEQTFTFHSLPERSELRVALAVSTSLDAEARPDGSLRFFREGVEVNYSRAFAVDASGLKLPIETNWDGARIELVVAEEIVRGATLPLTIDPVITVTVPDFGFGNDGFPEVVWNRALGAYVVAFQDRVLSTDNDIYAFAITQTGNLVQGSLQMLDASTVDHRRPRLAVHQDDSRMMAVALGRTQPGQRRRVYSMPFRATSVGGSYFSVGPINQPNEAPGLRDCSAADVGARSTADNDNAFLVVWEVEGFVGGGDVRGRFISDDGTMGSATLDFETGSSNSILPRVSASTGDPAFPNGTFNVVWIDDSDDDGRGAVHMRRVNPATENIGSVIIVHSVQDAVEAVATSNLSKELELSGARATVVAFVRQAGSGSSMTSSVSARLIKLTNQGGVTRVISDMEDVRPDYLQADVDIATDGDGFMLVYTERTSVGNTRVYMCSGGIMDRSNSGFSVTLSERHQILETTTADSRTPAICTQFDGGVFSGPLADDGACVWQEYDGFTQFDIYFGRIDLQNNLPAFGDRPVGVQFCAAERNAGGKTGWIHAEAPDQSVTTPLRLVAEDLQLNATGYLIVADTPGYVVGPGGSAGNLCVIGAGRYVNDVGNSGTTGQILTTVNPQALPQPTGTVSALPGDTWYFQYWYRDIQFGFPTSNFTNAAAVFFTQ